MGFVRTNSISGEPLRPGLGLGQILLIVLVFLGRAVFARTTLTEATFTFFGMVLFDMLAFHFFIAVVKASVPKRGREA
jgi:hypothetical protein